MITLQNKPNSNPIQTQFQEGLKMMQAQYLQRIKNKNANWLYLKQSQNKPNFPTRKIIEIKSRFI
jgi:hypothetical protein